MVKRELKAAVEAAAAAQDRGVDADQPAFDVEERAAGVAGVDRGVGLDEIFILLDAEPAPAERAHDAAAHRLPDAEGIADRQHHVAHFELVAVAERRRGETGRVDFHDRHIGLGIAADDRGLEFPARLAEGDLHLVGAVDHVVVRQNIAVSRDDHARAEPLLHRAAAAAPAAFVGIRHAEEPAKLRIVEKRRHLRRDLRLLRRKHIDHARRRALHDGGVAHAVGRVAVDGFRVELKHQRRALGGFGFFLAAEREAAGADHGGQGGENKGGTEQAVIHGSRRFWAKEPPTLTFSSATGSLAPAAGA